jgi:5,6-dimethylbenzimidazole synthase
MDVWQAIEKRRSVRAFKGGVSDELLRKIILAGTKAPTAGNSQPWEFIIVKDSKIIEKIAMQKYKANLSRGEEAATRQKNAYQNASVVAICYKTGPNATIAAWLASLNMELAATAEGFGCVTSTTGGEYKAAIEKILGLPEGYELATVLIVGVPVSVPHKREGGVERTEFSWLHINKFGSDL